MDEENKLPQQEDVDLGKYSPATQARVAEEGGGEFKVELARYMAGKTLPQDLMLRFRLRAKELKEAEPEKSWEGVFNQAKEELGLDL